MAHGGHWEAITGDVESAVKQIIPTACQEGKPLAGSGVFPWTDEEIGRVENVTASAIGYPDAAIQHLMLIVSRDVEGKQKHELATAYPFLRGGIVSPLQLVEVDESDPPFEAVLEADFADGAVVKFFDPLYYRHRAAYRSGEQYRFSLAALAYSVEKLDDPKFEVDAGPMLELHRQEKVRENPGLDPASIKSVTIHTAGAAIYFPTGDSASYQARIEAVEFMPVWPTTFYRLTVAILMVDDLPLRIYLYASSDVLGDYTPQPGDDISGTMWLQGYLATD